MTISGPRLRSLLRQAERAKEAGKLAASAQSYRGIIEEAPESPEAWLGLADVLLDPAEKQAAYEKVLALDADNKGAANGLAQLRGEPLPWPEPEPEPEEEPEPVADDVVVAETAVSASSAQAAPPSAVHTHTHSPQTDPAEEAEFNLVCYRHPDRETALRCYSCNRPICISCANKTPVGYICPECKHEAEEKFFTASKLDYVIAGIISFVLSLIAGVIVVRLGSGFLLILLVFFVGGAVGGFIAKLTHRVIKGRRGRYLPHLVATMVILGVVIPAMPYLLVALLGGGIEALFGLLVPGIYAFIASSSAFYWMR